MEGGMWGFSRKQRISGMSFALQITSVVSISRMSSQHSGISLLLALIFPLSLC